MKKCRNLLLLVSLLLVSLLAAGCGGSDKFSGRWISEPPEHNPWGQPSSRVMEIKANGDKGYIIKTYLWEYDKTTDEVKMNNEEKLTATKTKEGNTIRIQGLLGNPPIVYDENNKTLSSDVGRSTGITLEFKQAKEDKDVEQIKEKVLEYGRKNNKKK